MKRKFSLQERAQTRSNEVNSCSATTLWHHSKMTSLELRSQTSRLNDGLRTWKHCSLYPEILLTFCTILWVWRDWRDFKDRRRELKAKEQRKTWEPHEEWESLPAKLSVNSSKQHVQTRLEKMVWQSRRGKRGRRGDAKEQRQHSRWQRKKVERRDGRQDWREEQRLKEKEEILRMKRTETKPAQPEKRRETWNGSFRKFPFASRNTLTSVHVCNVRKTNCLTCTLCFMSFIYVNVVL